MDPTPRALLLALILAPAALAGFAVERWRMRRCFAGLDRRWAERARRGRAAS